MNDLNWKVLSGKYDVMELNIVMPYLRFSWTVFNFSINLD